MSLVELPGFERAVEAHAWAGNRLPVPYYGDRQCTRCSFGVVVVLDPVAQPALFYHAGYGETERKTIALCLACGHSSVMKVETLNPRW